MAHEAMSQDIKAWTCHILPKSEENKVCTRSNVMVFFVSLDYHRGLEQWSARHFDLVKDSGSNPLPATTNFKLETERL